MVSFASNEPARKKNARVSMTRAEAMAVIAAVTISVAKIEPPRKQGERLERLMNKIIDAFGFDYHMCDECGDISIDGTVVLVVDKEDSNGCECN